MGKNITRKNELTGINQDSLILSSTLEISTDIVITINVIDFNYVRVLLSDGSTNNFISISTNGSVALTTVGGGTGTTANALQLGVNTIKVRRDGAVNRLSVNGGSEFSSFADPLKFNTFGSRSGDFFDNNIIKFIANGIEVSLDEGNGVDFSSKDGTITGTRNTSHSDGINYINNSMIQGLSVKQTERSRVLVGANEDSIDLDSSYTLADGEYIEFLIIINSFTDSYVAGNQSLATDYIIFSSSLCQLRDNAANFINLNYSFSIGVQYKIKLTRVVNDINLYVNDVLQDTDTAGSSLTFNTVGRRRDLGNATLEVNYVDFNSTVFLLNEGNGITVISNTGDTGICKTSHSDDINYINQEMIQKIN
jgi:hypothetical protein